MNTSILVIGVGKGLGKFLVESMKGFSNKIAVSRSKLENGVEALHIQCSANELQSNLQNLETSSVSLVVYIPSAWGESGNLEDSEYEEFMQAGPEGLLSSFNGLKEKKILQDNALFINIGSTASEKATSVSSGLTSPLYSIAKLTQKAVVVQLARANRQYRFATITLGAIGEDDNNGVGHENIKRAVEFLYEMTNGVSYTDIELVAKSDIK